MNSPIGSLEADVGFALGGARREFEEDVFAGCSDDGPSPRAFVVARLLGEGGGAGVGPVMDLQAQNTNKI